MHLTIPPGPFDACIFDLDGTLADTMPLHYQAWRQELALHGYDMDEDEFYSLGGVSAVDVIRRINQRAGLNMDPVAVAASKEKRYLQLVPHAEPIQPVVDWMLAHHNEMPMAIATGSQRTVALATLNHLELTPYFRAIICIEDSARGKPAPDPFLNAAAKLGVNPTKCLAFEDGRQGIQAAQTAGMAYVYVPSREMKTTV